MIFIFDIEMVLTEGIFSCEDAAQQVLMSVCLSVCGHFEIPCCQKVLEGLKKFQKVPEGS